MEYRTIRLGAVWHSSLTVLTIKNIGMTSEKSHECYLSGHGTLMMARVDTYWPSGCSNFALCRRLSVFITYIIYYTKRTRLSRHRVIPSCCSAHSQQRLQECRACCGSSPRPIVARSGRGMKSRVLSVDKARFPSKRNRLRCVRCVRCVNENRKKRKRLRWQAANHGCHCFDRAFLLAAGACSQ